MYYIESMLWLIASACLISLILVSWSCGHRSKVVKTDIRVGQPTAVFVRIDSSVYKSAIIQPGDDFYIEVWADFKMHKKAWVKMALEGYRISANSRVFIQDWPTIQHCVHDYAAFHNIVYDQAYKELGGMNQNEVEDALRIYANYLKTDH